MRPRAYTVCIVGQDGGWARIGSLGRLQWAWCNWNGAVGSRAGWGSAVQLPPRPGGLQCSSLQGPGAPSGGGSHRSRLGWWVDSKQLRHLGRALDAIDDLPAVRARPFAADAHIGCGKSEAKLGTGRSAELRKRQQFKRMRLSRPMVHSSKQPWSVWPMSATSTSTPGTSAPSSSNSASVLFAPFLLQ